ncbi:hypothetical protein PF010_g13763 [Phytophthora fragariae]|uniref:Protein kinase domain-containing protein n=1 Tax=Phytophthora fragariae TaxID=53985 RepID=A0A6G0KYV4_9STRA|nr:hypothetical protein PF010_g13763 [Phytophthora fragariae]KAE9217164.1 hypothetical protein PF004_g14226 [Phytophthora fragariae]
MEAQSFLIVGLKGSHLSRETLLELVPRCSRMPELEAPITKLLARLQLLHDLVASRDPMDPVKRQYIDVVVSETLVAAIRELQLKLSDVAQALGVADTPEMTAWSEGWGDVWGQQCSILNDLVAGTPENLLASEFRGDKKLQAVLMTLNSSLHWNSQAPEMQQLKRATLDRVMQCSNQQGLRLFPWFIPMDDVEFEDESIMGTGTIGHTSRGTWRRDGVRIDVMVKCLFKETSDDVDVEEAFLRQLELWVNLPDSAHILKLYGGSHASQPPFYVCENAYNGNIADFLGDGTHSVMFWRLFEQVVKGLKFLHEMNIVHGGLRCSNILIGADYTAKISDFGFSSVRTLSAGLSAGSAKASAATVRWKPKEVFTDPGTDAKRFESDVYSLAMSMIEAKAGLPFCDADDAEAFAQIKKGEEHPRPDEVTDDEWKFIRQLCNPDFSLRPTLNQVLERMNVFAQEEERRYPRAHIA